METYPDLPSDVVDAIQRGRKIEAIRRLRKTEGMGLREAKEAVDAWVEGTARNNPHLVQDAGPSGTLLGRVVIIAIALAAGYFVYRWMNG